MPYELLALLSFFAVVVFVGLASLYRDTEIKCRKIISEAEKGRREGHSGLASKPAYEFGQGGKK